MPTQQNVDVLLAHDEPSLVSAMSRALSIEGYKTAIVSREIELRAFLRAYQPPITVISTHLSVTLCRQLRPKMSVIALLNGRGQVPRSKFVLTMPLEPLDIGRLVESCEKLYPPLGAVAVPMRKITRLFADHRSYRDTSDLDAIALSRLNGALDILLALRFPGTCATTLEILKRPARGDEARKGIAQLRKA